LPLRRQHAGTLFCWKQRASGANKLAIRMTSIELAISRFNAMNSLKSLDHALSRKPASSAVLKERASSPQQIGGQHDAMPASPHIVSYGNAPRTGELRAR